MDLDRPDWGNLESNIVFLKRTGLLDQPKTILEIGCGQGRLATALQEGGHKVVAVDVAAEALAVVPPELDARLIEGVELPFEDDSFDLVLSFDVIEHIPETDLHLSEVRRVLKPGGHYLFQTPNKWTNIPFEMLRWSVRYGVRRMFDFLKPPQHCALHSYGELQARLRKNGYGYDFFDVPVVNKYFREKVRTYAGRFGVLLLRIVPIDRLPRPLRTNFYVKAQLLAE